MPDIVATNPVPRKSAILCQGCTLTLSNQPHGQLYARRTMTTWRAAEWRPAFRRNGWNNIYQLNYIRSDDLNTILGQVSLDVILCFIVHGLIYRFSRATDF